MQKVPVVIGKADERSIVDCQWGLVPGWADDPKIGARMINARSETVAIKPAFRAAFRNGRCIIPADGFYEWRKIPGGKQPVYIHPADEAPLAFAGLYSSWRGRDSAEVLLSCTIITSEADSWMSQVHDRMPVILPDSVWESWTDPAQPGETILNAVLKSPTSRTMLMTDVSHLVNSPANDRIECISPSVVEV